MIPRTGDVFAFFVERTELAVFIIRWVHFDSLHMKLNSREQTCLKTANFRHVIQVTCVIDNTVCVILLYGNWWLHSLFSGTNLQTNTWIPIILCKLHDSFLVHVHGSVTKRTLANCCLVPCKILCIGWRSILIPCDFSLSYRNSKKYRPLF